jgi:hypothetical protein
LAKQAVKAGRELVRKQLTENEWATLEGGKSNLTSKFGALLQMYVLTKGTFLMEEPGSMLLLPATRSPDELLRRRDRREKLSPLSARSGL